MPPYEYRNKASELLHGNLDRDDFIELMDEFEFLIDAEASECQERASQQLEQCLCRLGDFSSG